MISRGNLFRWDEGLPRRISGGNPEKIPGGILDGHFRGMRGETPRQIPQGVLETCPGKFLKKLLEESLKELLYEFLNELLEKFLKVSVNPLGKI